VRTQLADIDETPDPSTMNLAEALTTRVALAAS